MVSAPEPKMVRRRAVIALATGLAFFLALTSLPRLLAERGGAPVFGVTFSAKHVRELGLDPKEAFIAVLDDLKVRRLRIPVYWDEAERTEGAYDWSETDWMLEEAGRRGAEVILAVGRKVPRWPECHEPEWVKGREAMGEGAEDALLTFLAAEIGHFKTFPAISMWQVENEALFAFGECPPPDRPLLKREVDLVRSLDGRPIMLTDSGELSTWVRTGTLADVLGISLYRLVWNTTLGELYWPVSPLYYAERIGLIRPAVGSVIISELQAEPWFVKPPSETPFEEQFKQMSPRRLEANAAYARLVGAPEVLLWGVEWWFWAKTKGYPEMWEAARALF